MQLKLFTWPPLASHLACLIVGYAISQFGVDKSKAKEFKFSPDLIYFRAEKKFEKLLKNLKVNQDYFVKFNIGATDENNSEKCLLLSHPIKILSPKAPFVLSAHMEDSSSLLTWMNLRRPKSKISFDSLRSNEQSCQQKVEVSYGT